MSVSMCLPSRPVALFGLLLSGSFFSFFTPLQAAPRIVFSNVVGSCCGADSVAGATFGAVSLAEAFTPAVTDTMTGARVLVYQVAVPGADPHFNISLFSDANGAPGLPIEQFGTNLVAFNNSPVFVTAKSTLKPTLRAGQQYWLVLTPANNSTDIGWVQGGNPSVPARTTTSTAGQGGWTVFSATGTADLQFEIDGTIDIPCAISGSQILAVVYVISGTKIEEFDLNGKFIVEFGGTGSGPGQFELPSGIVSDLGSGNVFVADAVLNRIQQFDSCGNLISRFGSTGSAPGLLYHPYGLTTDTAGNVWVADTGNNRIQAFRIYTGAYVTQLGGLGGGQGQFNAPVGVSISGSQLWVADTGNNRIQQFNVAYSRDTAFPTPTFTLQFGSYGGGNGQLNGPFGVSVGTNVWVADSQNRRIEEFTAGGAFVQSLGPFSFPSPYGVSAFAGIWAVDYNTNRVEQFSAAGVLIQTFGTTGGGPGQLYHPTYIAVGYNQSLA